MLDFILKVLRKKYRAFIFKPRHMEISLGYLENPLESPHQIVHSAMHIRISPIDQMIMYAHNRQKKEKKLGVPTRKEYLADVTFDSVFTNELHKLNTEEEDNKDV